MDSELAAKSVIGPRDFARARWRQSGMTDYSAGSTAYFFVSGYCRPAKRKVNGITPNTLKSTQTSVEVLRQTISLSTASAKKKNIQRNVSLRQPSSVSWNSESNTTPSNGLLKQSPPNNKPPNNA